MRLGEVRKLRIPAHEGYGANGFPAWGIPPGGVLNFTIEVLEINGQGMSSQDAFQPIAGCETVYKVKQAGSGSRKVQRGNRVTVHALGVVKETGKKFWSTKDPGQRPFTYDAGVGKVIKGGDQGCLGMQVGEVRELIIPAREGYGVNGFPTWGIPPNGTLNFTIEILQIN